jgi:hypothetical protein
MKSGASSFDEEVVPITQPSLNHTRQPGWYQQHS